MPSKEAQKALADGLITQKQYDKLPPHFLEAIVKSKRKKGGTKKPKRKKGKKGKK